MKQVAKRSMVTMLIAAMLVTLLAMYSPKQAQAADMKLIYTAQELYEIRQNMSGNYKLMADIDLTELTAEGGKYDFNGNGWNPIGSEGIYGSTEFTGTFDGNGHTIKGLQIHVNTLPEGSAELYLGLFASVSGTVKNLTMEDVSITNTVFYQPETIAIPQTFSPTMYCGAISADGGTLINCHVNGTISVKGGAGITAVGGLIGDGGSATDCSNSADITVSSEGMGYYTETLSEGMTRRHYDVQIYLGGIAGLHCEASECYNTGDLSAYCKNPLGAGYQATQQVTVETAASSYVGGISGFSYLSTTNCYNTGKVYASTVNKGGEKTEYGDANNYLNGISYQSVKTSYNIGEVSGSVNDGEETAGYAVNTKITSASYNYYKKSTGETSVQGTTGIADQLLTQEVSYNNFDFKLVWTIDPTLTYKYPQFINNRQSTAKALTDIELDTDELSLSTNESGQLSASTSPSNAGEEITWTSSDPSVATVDETGKVTALRYGTATITASNTDGSIASSCEIKTLFYDVAGSNVKGDSDYQYYYDPVYWAADNGITTGYDRVYFGPKQECTRAEMMIFLWRMAGKPTGYGDARNYFNDLSAYGTSTATNQAIAWGYKSGITKGYSDGGFHPKASIARKDTMILLYRLAEKPAVSGTLSFKDCSYPKTSDTYKAILWGSKNNITAGYSDGSFKPLDSCLREHIVTFLYRYHNLMES